MILDRFEVNEKVVCIDSYECFPNTDINADWVKQRNEYAYSKYKVNHGRLKLGVCVIIDKSEYNYLVQQNGISYVARTKALSKFIEGKHYEYD